MHSQHIHVGVSKFGTLNTKVDHEGGVGGVGRKVTWWIMREG